jgi:NgoFVII restriction endonuclease.
MDFLFSNYPPLKTNSKTFYDTFYDNLAKSQRLDIAVGYITADSLSDLKNTLQVNSTKLLNLIIGMHYFEKFSKLEYDAAMDLHIFLKNNKLGSVRLVTPFRYHGKLYTYSDNTGAFAGIIGSDNLSSIVEDKSRIYEASLFINDRSYVQKMQEFINRLYETSTPIDKLTITEFKQQNKLLENHDYVEKVSSSTVAECMSACTNVKFDIPIKAGKGHTKSSLNVFNGKGRKGKNGLVKPRHWYEVELIVGKEITLKADYPKVGTNEAVFDVITDDGWKFKCKVSGDYSKNFRSENDLKILGKWLKGRLENAGVLKVGELVTEETLNKYGRTTFTLTKTKIPDLWYLDFGVR